MADDTPCRDLMREGVVGTQHEQTPFSIDIWMPTETLFSS
jgi:hypothetical protein